jgi:hydroxyacylglutathione hydrolase
VLLERFVNGRARSNAYVLAPLGHGPCVIVDPGVGAAGKIAALVRDASLHPECILLTHGHPDHVWTSGELSELFDVPVYLHASDHRWLDDPASGGYVPLVRVAGRIIGRARRLRPSRLVALPAGGTLTQAGVPFDVLHTPGHTEGSVCLVGGELCFAGDTVFRGGIGHTVYPGGRRSALERSIRSELLRLRDPVRVLPGHGGETTVGTERARWELVGTEG